MGSPSFTFVRTLLLGEKRFGPTIASCNTRIKVHYQLLLRVFDHIMLSSKKKQKVELQRARQYV